MRKIYVLQPVLHVRIRNGATSLDHREADKKTDRFDGVGQTERPLRQRRLRHGSAASLPASVHVHRLHGRRLARQAAVRAATSPNEPTATC